MKNRRRFVIDTNVLISACMVPDATPHTVVIYAALTGYILMSASTFHELKAKFESKKIQSCIDIDIYKDLMLSLTQRSRLVIPSGEPVTVCRDPDDNKILEVAVSGKADYIITGDKDLLVLHPFQGIPILTPSQFVDLIEQQNGYGNAA